MEHVPFAHKSAVPVDVPIPHGCCQGLPPIEQVHQKYLSTHVPPVVHVCVISTFLLIVPSSVPEIFAILQGGVEYVQLEVTVTVVPIVTPKAAPNDASTPGTPTVTMELIVAVADCVCERDVPKSQTNDPDGGFSGHPGSFSSLQFLHSKAPTTVIGVPGKTTTGAPSERRHQF